MRSNAWDAAVKRLIGDSPNGEALWEFSRCDVLVRDLVGLAIVNPDLSREELLEYLCIEMAKRYQLMLKQAVALKQVQTMRYEMPLYPRCQWPLQKTEEPGP